MLLNNCISKPFICDFILFFFGLKCYFSMVHCLNWNQSRDITIIIKKGKWMKRICNCLGDNDGPAVLKLFESKWKVWTNIYLISIIMALGILICYYILVYKKTLTIEIGNKKTVIVIESRFFGVLEIFLFSFCYIFLSKF